MGVAESTNRYNELALDFGELTHNGVDYALEAVPALSADGCARRNQARDGESYRAQYEAPGLSRAGDEVVLVWDLQVVRGREPDDDFTGWWDGVNDVRAS